MGDLGSGEPVAGFGALLRRLREQRALTQEELAERAGLAATAVSALERGVRRRPYPHTVRALADALGLDVADRETLLAAVPSRGTRPTPAAEPVPSAPLIGRADEIATVVELLRSGRQRVVTLTGPGGVGKTRLAEAVAARLDAELPVTVVELAAVRDPAMVLPAIARTAGVPERPGAVAGDVVAELVGDQRMLLVLDNLEQLLAGAADLAALVERCPRLLVLGTSRAPLRIRAEHEVVVAPLAVPDAWAGADPEEIRAAPAVAMLLDRAAAMGGPLDLTPANAATVAAIVWRLDGLPLAIELAASRLRLLDAETLLSRLDDAMTGGGLRDLPGRQQTIPATLDWSVELLTEPQRRLFAALAAFDGGFTLAAAEAVDGATGGLDRLAALVEQSLVMRVDGAGLRFRLLEPVRQYASARWSGTPLGAEAAGRHAEYFSRVAERARPRLHGADLAATLDELDRDHANLRAAQQHLVAEGRLEAAAAMAWDLWLFLALRGRAAEWRDRLSSPAGEPREDAALARWLGARAALAYVVQDLSPARRDMAAALVLARRHGDPDLAAETAALAALMAVFVGDADAAEAFDAIGRTATGENDGFSRILLGAGAGQRAILGGDLDAADRALGEAESLARGLGNGFGLALTLNMRATVAETRGNDRQALPLLAESVERSVQDRMGWTLGYALPALAAVAARTGDDLAAALLSGAAAAITGSREGAGHVPASRVAAHAPVAEVRARLGAEVYTRTLEEGRALSLDDLAEVAAALRRRELG